MKGEAGEKKEIEIGKLRDFYSLNIEGCRVAECFDFWRFSKRRSCAYESLENLENTATVVSSVVGISYWITVWIHSKSYKLKIGRFSSHPPSNDLALRNNQTKLLVLNSSQLRYGTLIQVLIT